MAATGHVRTTILIRGSAHRASKSAGLLGSGGGGQPRLDDLAGLGGLAPVRGRLEGSRISISLLCSDHGRSPRSGRLSGDFGSGESGAGRVSRGSSLLRLLMSVSAPDLCWRADVRRAPARRRRGQREHRGPPCCCQRPFLTASWPSLMLSGEAAEKPRKIHDRDRRTAGQGVGFATKTGFFSSLSGEHQGGHVGL